MDDIQLIIRAVDQASPTFRRIRQEVAALGATVSRTATAPFRTLGTVLGLLRGPLGLVMTGLRAVLGVAGRLAGGILSLAGNLGGALLGAVGRLAQALGSALLNAIMAVAQAVGSLLLQALSGFASLITGVVLPALARLAGFIGGAVLGVLQRLASVLATGLVVGASGFAAALAAIGRAGVDMNITLQTTERAFTKIAGSTQAAQKFISDLREEAKVSALTFKELLPLSQSLGAVFTEVYGVRGLGRVIGTMRTFGDVAVTLGVGIEDQKLAIRGFRQLLASDVPTREDMKQIDEALPGAGVMGIVARSFGTTDGEQLKRAGVRGAQVAEAILAGMRSKFGGAQAQAAGSIPVLLGNIKDAFTEVSSTVTGGFTERVGKALKSVLDTLNRLQDSAGGRNILKFLTEGFNRVGDVLVKLAEQLPKVVDWIGRLVEPSRLQRFAAQVRAGFQAFWSFGQQAIIAVRDRWAQLWPQIQARTAAGVNFVGRMLAVILPVAQGVINWVRENWKGLWDAAVANVRRASAFVVTVLSIFIPAAQRVISWIGTNWQNLWESAQEWVQTAWEFFRIVWTQLADYFGGVTKGLEIDWTAVWEAIKAITVASVKVVGGVIAGLINVFRELFATQQDGKKGIEGLGESFRQFAIVAVEAVARVVKQMYALQVAAGLFKVIVGGAMVLSGNPAAVASGLAMQGQGAAQAAAAGTAMGLAELGRQRTVQELERLDLSKIGQGFIDYRNQPGTMGAFSRGYLGFGETVDRGISGAEYAFTEARRRAEAARAAREAQRGMLPALPNFTPFQTTPFQTSAMPGLMDLAGILRGLGGRVAGAFSGAAGPAPDPMADYFSPVRLANGQVIARGAAEQMGVKSTPVTFPGGEGGKIIVINIGASTPQAVESQVLGILRRELREAEYGVGGP